MSGVDVLVATLRSFGEQAANGGVAFKDLTKTLLPLMEVIFPYTRSMLASVTNGAHNQRMRRNSRSLMSHSSGSSMIV